MRSICALAVIMTIAATSEARGRRWSIKPQCPGGQCPAPAAHPTTQNPVTLGVNSGKPTLTPELVVLANINSASDALDEVNAKRAARGLRPYVRDDGLTRAAQSCAAFRAQHRLFGHTSNDFQFLSAGSRASAAGCAAYPASYGWMSCAVYENHTYAGAAYVTGTDGKRYMHLFVR